MTTSQMSLFLFFSCRTVSSSVTITLYVLSLFCYLELWNILKYADTIVPSAFFQLLDVALNN